jgi:hypothetical protein
MRPFGLLNETLAIKLTMLAIFSIAALGALAYLRLSKMQVGTN